MTCAWICFSPIIGPRTAPSAISPQTNAPAPCPMDSITTRWAAAQPWLSARGSELAAFGAALEDAARRGSTAPLANARHEVLRTGAAAAALVALLLLPRGRAAVLCTLDTVAATLLCVLLLGLLLSVPLGASRPPRAGVGRVGGWDVRQRAPPRPGPMRLLSPFHTHAWPNPSPHLNPPHPAHPPHPLRARPAVPVAARAAAGRGQGDAGRGARACQPGAAAARGVGQTAPGAGAGAAAPAFGGVRPAG